MICSSANVVRGGVSEDMSAAALSASGGLGSPMIVSLWHVSRLMRNQFNLT